MEKDDPLFLNSWNSISEDIMETGILQNESSQTFSPYSVQPQKYRNCEVLADDLENEFDLKIGIKPNDDVTKYKQLVYEYYTKAEDLESKCTMLCRNLQEMKEAWEKTKISKDLALKEKENMTLNFAKGEKKIWYQKDLKEKAEKKCEELTKEIETLQRKLQIKTQEKARISSIYDNKIHELKCIKIENDRIINENCILKNEMKLCQIALKNQAELNKKAQNTIEDLNRRIEKFSTDKKDEAESLQHLQQKLKEVEIERDKKDQQLQNLQISIDNSSSKHRYEDQLEHEGFSDTTYKEISDNESIPKLYESENNSDETNHLLNQLEMKNRDLENDIQLCRVKESESLLFSKQLSEKNVELQSEHFNFQNIIQELTEEKNDLKEQCKKLKVEFASSSKHFADEKETLHNENIQISTELDCLKRNLAEQNRENLKLKQQLVDLHEEFIITRKKYNSSIREFRREIKLCKSSDGIYLSGSPSYLSTISKYTDSSYNPIEITQTEKTWIQQDLIQRIIRLQETSVRKSEKIDFLKDQIEAFLLELRKKEKLLQFFFLQAQTEILISNEMSDAKVKISELGGVMASLYDARIADDTLSFELLLEINCKLQAVLEDVLLKNIILKSNIEILGEEIEKLNKQLKHTEEG